MGREASGREGMKAYRVWGAGGAGAVTALRDGEQGRSTLGTVLSPHGPQGK